MISEIGPNFLSRVAPLPLRSKNSKEHFPASENSRDIDEKRRFGDRSRGINKEDPIGSSREKELVRGLAGNGDGETYLTNGEVH